MKLRTDIVFQNTSGVAGGALVANMAEDLGQPADVCCAWKGRHTPTTGRSGFRLVSAYSTVFDKMTHYVDKKGKEYTLMKGFEEGDFVLFSEDDKAFIFDKTQLSEAR